MRKCGRMLRQSVLAHAVEQRGLSHANGERRRSDGLETDPLEQHVGGEVVTYRSDEGTGVPDGESVNPEHVPEPGVGNREGGGSLDPFLERKLTGLDLARDLHEQEELADARGAQREAGFIVPQGLTGHRIQHRHRPRDPLEGARRGIRFERTHGSAFGHDSLLDSLVGHRSRARAVLAIDAIKAPHRQ